MTEFLRPLTTGSITWVTFIISAALIVYVAMQLAKFGDVIAARTGISGLFIGVLLLAGATSLPEMLTGISAVLTHQPNIAAGNLFGSSAFNMFILVILDVLSRDQSLFHNAGMKNIISGSMAVFLGTLPVLFIAANPVLEKIGFKIGWMGIDSLLIIAFYILGIYLIRNSEAGQISTEMTEEELATIPTLKNAVGGFILFSAVLVIATPIMVMCSTTIAEITGLGTGFIGSTLVAIITSLPELVTSIAAIKIGSADMAFGNHIGSNMFNMFGIALMDLFYTQGRLLNYIDNSFIIVGMLGVLMTSFALVGNIAKFKRLKFMDMNSLILAFMYFGGMYILYIM